MTKSLFPALRQLGASDNLQFNIWISPQPCHCIEFSVKNFFISKPVYKADNVSIAQALTFIQWFNYGPLFLLWTVNISINKLSSIVVYITINCSAPIKGTMVMLSMLLFSFSHFLTYLSISLILSLSLFLSLSPFLVFIKGYLSTSFYTSPNPNPHS